LCLFESIPEREVNMFVSHSRSARTIIALGLLLAGAVVVLICTSRTGQSDLTLASEMALRKPAGAPQLVSVEPLPSADGETCQWMPASVSSKLSAALTEAMLQEEDSESASSAKKGSAAVGNADRKPARTIRDTFPTYSAITVNLQKDEVLMQDENLFGIK